MIDQLADLLERRLTRAVSDYGPDTAIAVCWGPRWGCDVGLDGACVHCKIIRADDGLTLKAHAHILRKGNA